MQTQSKGFWQGKEMGYRSAQRALEKQQDMLTALIGALIAFTGVYLPKVTRLYAVNPCVLLCVNPP